MATITVQTILNRGVSVNVTVNLTDTIATLKTSVKNATGIDTTWFDIYYNGLVLDTTKTLNFYNIPAGAVVGSTNLISRLATKQLKQEAKLGLAALRRATTGRHSVYDINKLPTKYSNNNVVNNPNVGGLVSGRPWS